MKAGSKQGGEGERRPFDRRAHEGFERYVASLGLELPPGIALSPAVWWSAGKVMILDQRRLPHRLEVLACRRVEEVAAAIRAMAVRGAPAIGLAAAYGLALGMSEPSGAAASGWAGERLAKASRLLLDARPTAVNLAAAVGRMRDCLAGTTAERDGWGDALGRIAGGEEGSEEEGIADSGVPPALLLQREAARLHRAIVLQDLAMASLGLGLLQPGERILTHCHTGGTATGGLGTALGVIKAAHRAGLGVSVLCCETRPLLQGARLTAWELAREGIPFHLIADAAAAHFIGRGEVDRVLVGADRIAVSGDTANKIGTRGLALLAWQAGIPFHVVAPTSSIDLDLPTGEGIPLEERDGEELRRLAGVAACAAGTPVRNPAFDLTPGEMVTSFVTERGILHPPLDAAAVFARTAVEKGEVSGGRKAGRQTGRQTGREAAKSSRSSAGRAAARPAARPPRAGRKGRHAGGPPEREGSALRPRPSTGRRESTPPRPRRRPRGGGGPRR